MKLFIGRLILFSIFIVMLLVFGVSHITTKWQGDYLYALIDKFNHLEKEESPKIILIGGSNLAFGMDSETLSHYYNLPVVNMGLHAGIGLRFLLEGIKENVNKNDLVLIISEYSHSFNMIGYSSTLIPVICNVYPKGIKYLSFEQILMTLSGIPRYAIDNLYDAYIKGHAFKHYEHKIYNRTNFNQYGDMTAHWMEVSYVSCKYKKQKSQPIDWEMLKELEQYVQIYQSQGAKVVILPPAIFNTEALSMGEEIQLVTEALKKNDNEAFQYFYPQKYFLPDSLGYDTKYHFLKPGIDIRMQYLIEDLNVFLDN